MDSIADLKTQNAFKGLVSAAIGILTLSQAAGQLPFADQGNALVFTQRLVARKSLRSKTMEGSVLIEVGDIKDFLQNGSQNPLRKVFDMPQETLSPIFGAGEKWFGEGPAMFEYSNWRDAFFRELTLQFPREVLITDKAILSNQEGFLIVNPDPVTRQVFPSYVYVASNDRLNAMAKLPVPGAPDFLNMAEILLCKRLQQIAYAAAMKAIFMAYIGTGNSGLAPMRSAADVYGPALAQKPCDLSALYQDAATYGFIVTQALAELHAAPIFSEQRLIDGHIVLLLMRAELLMQMARTTDVRLAALAF